MKRLILDIEPLPPKKCSEPGCNEKLHGCGLCANHYNQICNKKEKCKKRDNVWHRMKYKNDRLYRLKQNQQNKKWREEHREERSIDKKLYYLENRHRISWKNQIRRNLPKILDGTL